MAKITTNTNKARWDKFCLEYVKDFNPSRAYKAAGYKSKNPRQHAYRIMVTNGYVQEKIKKLLKGQAERAEKTSDDIIKELEKIGFKRTKLPQSGRLSDRIKSLELLGKRFGIFPNKTDIGGKDGKPIPVSIVDFGKINDDSE